ncbi:MAG TPA: nucleosidase [Gammaproteobacteria bacterium]|nr:nucleosidase [Gammaproteobacteria bacterium]
MAIPEAGWKPGIVVALPAEAKTLRAYREFVTLSGIGPRRATAAAERLIAQGVSALLSWGIAGGLSAALRPGDIVLPDFICTPEEPAGLPVDARWRRCIADALTTSLNPGKLWSSRLPVASVDDKRALCTDGMVAVDMESGAIAAVAARAGVPFVAVKAVCDPADRMLPPAVVGLLDAEGRLTTRGAAGLLRGGLPAWRAANALRRDFGAARHALVAAAEALPVILQHPDVTKDTVS